MNVCFAICITLLIYQNNELNKEIASNQDISNLIIERIGMDINAEEDFWTINERLTSYGSKVVENDSAISYLGIEVDDLRSDLAGTRGYVDVLVADALGELAN
tara:strand:- start:26 stop:334 length:309 start_codon:yes stop_codon:yes gene_type:complete